MRPAYSRAVRASRFRREIMFASLASYSKEERSTQNDRSEQKNEMGNLVKNTKKKKNIIKNKKKTSSDTTRVLTVHHSGKDTGPPPRRKTLKVGCCGGQEIRKKKRTSHCVVRTLDRVTCWHL